MSTYIVYLLVGLLTLVGVEGYKKSSMGKLCDYQALEIQTEQECINACAAMGITYLGSWNGPGDFPKCTYTEGLNRVCHFNTSPSPGRSSVNSQYSAICLECADTHSGGTARCEARKAKGDCGVKKSIIEGCELTCGVCTTYIDKSYCDNLENISMDFLDETKNLVNELTKANFSKGDPTIFVAEGLIMYLGAGKSRFLKEVSDAAAPGSVLILNFMQHSDDEEGRKMDPTYMSLEDLKSAMVNEGWDENSFQVNRFGDEVLNYGRFPNDKFQKSYSFSFLVSHKK